MCELVIKTAIGNGDYKKMNDTEILKKVKEYLENTESESVSTDIKEYSENLLFWIENWQN
jgi:phosphoribosylformylglycinamidine (FGAM) synthase PurS component